MIIIDFNAAVFDTSYDEISKLGNTSQREVRVHFDDGELILPVEDFIFNWFCWQLYTLEEFRGMKSSVEYSVSKVKHITTRTHLDICGWILKDFVFWSESKGITPDLRPIMKKIYEISNLIYNFVDNELDHHTTDICFDHLNAIYQHPEILEANIKVQTSAEVAHDDIQNVYDIINRVVISDPSLSNDALCVAARCGVIKLTQLSMVEGPIGYCTDINSKIIPDPIRVGFFRGINKLSHMLYESRNASISALFNIVIMPLSEYGNRRIQLPSENVQNIAITDCGGNSIRVSIIDKAHLKTLLGFNLTDGKSGKVIKYIEAEDTHLIGTSVYLRSLNYCRFKLRNTVCSTCMGSMHYSFPTGSVIGHSSGTQLGSSISTSVLQRKHQNLTSKATGMSIAEQYDRIFKVSETGSSLHFAPGFDFTKWSIVLNQHAALNIKEVNSEFGDGLVPSQTTRIEVLEIRSNDGLDSISLPIGLGQRAGFLTKEMLRYCKKHGWTFIDGVLYQLDLSSWDNEDEFLTIPQIEFTPPDLISTVTGFIFSGNKTKQSNFKTPLLANCLNVDDAYATFYDLIKNHLKLHSIHLQMIILAMSAQDPEVYDYRLPYPREFSRTVKLDDVMFFRSIGGGMAYEEQNQLFLNPITYLIDRRPPHIYDSIIMS